MQENILFFYKGAHGELHAGLPILMEIFAQKKNVNIYFIYSNEQYFADIPEFYREIIENNFTVLFINPKRLINLYIRKFNAKNYILTCDNGHNFYSRFLTYYWPFSRIAFFHHAYALLNSYLDERTVKEQADFKKNYSGGHHRPLLIAHNRTEIGFREKQGFKKDDIIVAGNLGYKKDWQTLLKKNSSKLTKLIENKQDYDKVVFIPTRNVHQEYLSKENSVYLLNSLNDIISLYPNYLFIIKPHPRGDNYQFRQLEDKHSNCRLTTLNTMTISAESDLVISYWSSSIIDALAVNTPVVEFHRHEDWHFQLVKTDSGLVSLYHYLGLCPFYNSVDEIISLLGDANSWNDLRYKQQKEFNKIFLKCYPEFVDHLFRRLETSPRQMKSYMKSAVTFPFSFLISKLKK